MDKTVVETMLIWEAPKIKPYDKVKFHLKAKKHAKNLHDAKMHIETMLIWLFRHKYLNPTGIKTIKSGTDIETSIHSGMLTPAGNKIMGKCYDKWLKTIKYGKKPDIKSFEKCAK